MARPCGRKGRVPGLFLEDVAGSVRDLLVDAAVLGETLLLLEGVET